VSRVTEEKLSLRNSAPTLASSALKKSSLSFAARFVAFEEDFGLRWQAQRDPTFLSRIQAVGQA
jgi:hypothetical protein